MLLFEAESALMAIAVVQQANSSRTADLVVLAVHCDLQGGWLQEEQPRPLCVAVLKETIRFAARAGYERIVAIVAAQNTKSVRLITRAGFAPVTDIDRDYLLYQAPT
ncbi:MAG: hypothetical protein ACRDK7_01945 [Solirubrobacteraceae bacterium]